MRCEQETVNSILEVLWGDWVQEIVSFSPICPYVKYTVALVHCYSLRVTTVVQTPLSLISVSRSSLALHNKTVLGSSLDTLECFLLETEQFMLLSIIVILYHRLIDYCTIWLFMLHCCQM